jgi:hypothetical protein
LFRAESDEHQFIKTYPSPRKARFAAAWLRLAAVVALIGITPALILIGS